jgi:hypothetical protein
VIHDLEGKTPLYTAYANNTIWPNSSTSAGAFYSQLNVPALYENIWTRSELDGARFSDCLHEDRVIMAATGALPSEIWS